MNKEIKDLIEQLNICSVNDYNFEIYGNEAKILKEYISNLQSENKQLKEVIDKTIEELKKGLNELDTRRREEVYIEQYIEEALNMLKEVE